MPVTLKMTGLTELRAALRNLPEELTGEASAIVLAHAEEAQRRIESGYPQGPTGNLKRGVVTQRSSSRFTAGATVLSRAKHAYLYEHGFTRKGKNTARKTPQAMIPIVVRVRAQMVRSLIQLVRSVGFEVNE